MGDLGRTRLVTEQTLEFLTHIRTAKNEQVPGELLLVGLFMI